MAKGKLKKRLLKTNTFKRYVWVVWGPADKAAEFANREQERSPENQVVWRESMGGWTAFSPAPYPVVIYLREQSLHGLVHELQHAVFRILGDCQVQYDEEDHEAHCYLLENFVKQSVKKIPWVKGAKA